MIQEKPSKKSEHFDKVFQNIVIDSQQQVSDHHSSSEQDSCQSSPPGDCPLIVRCSKSQTSLNIIVKR